jgi:acyl-CoA thioesterase-1
MMPNDIRICFIGDSFVNGTGDEAFQGWTGRVAAALQARIPAITSYNLGIRRDTSRDILARWRMEAERRLPDSCAGRLVFSFGVNDCIEVDGRRRVPWEESLGNAERIIASAAAWKPTLVIGPVPIALPDHGGLRQAIGDLSLRLAAICAAHRVPWIELFSRLDAEPAWTGDMQQGDGVHPGSAGYVRLAGLVLSWPDWEPWLCRAPARS